MHVRLALLLSIVFTVIAAPLPAVSEAVGGTGPPHVHFTSGEGTLPSGESFRFSAGYRADGASEGWLYWQRPGWAEFKATKIIRVWVPATTWAYVTGEGVWGGSAAVAFYLVATQQEAGGHVRLVIMPGSDTPALQADLPLATGSVRVAKAMGLQVYWCGLLSGTGQAGEGAGVAAWVFLNGNPVSGVPVEVLARYSNAGARRFGERVFTDQIGYAVTAEVLADSLADPSYILGVYWEGKWLLYARPWGTGYRCGE